jgi:hypothetical protein
MTCGMQCTDLSWSDGGMGPAIVYSHDEDLLMLIGYEW